ncbi:MAG: aldolase/citrate lyase family protein, partial [Methylococcaceae bacterium]
MSHTLYSASVSRVQRCELAVPGTSPEMFEKALKSGVDFIFLDLEDAVAPDDKLRARKNVIQAIND